MTMFINVIFSKYLIYLRWCANVVRIAMPSVLGFDDGGQYVEKTFGLKRRHVKSGVRM